LKNQITQGVFLLAEPVAEFPTGTSLNKLIGK
jgi:hypothetical protein